MKRLLALILINILCLGSVLGVYAEEIDEFGNTAPEIESETETEAPPEIKPGDVVSTEDIVLYSEGVVVMDMDTGAVLYSKNMDKRLYPASITKILTGYLACTYLDPEGEIWFTQEAIDGIDIWMDMNIGMEEGEMLTVDQALHALMMVSANEVACGLAIAVSGSISSFTDLMNQKVQEMGCENTHFVNANGLHDDNHYTTASDMAKIAALAYSNEKFRALIQEPVYVIDKTNKKEEPIELIQQHKMYMESDYTYEGCMGGKTGYTSEAESTLVTYAERGGMRLVCVAMKAENWHHYTDTIQALDYCFNTYTKTGVIGQTDLAVRLNAEYSDNMSVLDFNHRMSGRHFFIDKNAKINIYREGSLAEWTEHFEPAGQLALGIPPYSPYTSQCGTISYYNGSQYMGGVPVYEVLPLLKSSTGMSMKMVMSNARLIEMMEAKDAQMPALAKNGVDDAADSLYERLSQLELSPKRLMMIGAAVIIMLLFLISFVRMLGRRRRKRNYERLRRKRLEEKMREYESRKKE